MRHYLISENVDNSGWPLSSCVMISKHHHANSNETILRDHVKSSMSAKKGNSCRLSPDPPSPSKSTLSDSATPYLEKSTSPRLVKKYDMASKLPSPLWQKFPFFGDELLTWSLRLREILLARNRNPYPGYFCSVFKVTWYPSFHSSGPHRWFVCMICPLGLITIGLFERWAGLKVAVRQNGIHRGSACHRSIQTQRTSHTYTLPLWD